MSDSEKELPSLEPGFHFGVPESIYHRLPYLNATCINAFEMSPMDAWCRGGWNWDEDDQDQEATDAQNFGNARHCLILEGEEELFKRFCRKPHVDDYPGAMRNMTEMKTFLKEKGVKGYSSLNQDGLCDLVLDTDPSAQIASRLVKEAMQVNSGKTFLKPDHWDALMEHHEMFEGDYGIPQPGCPEVTIVWDLDGIRCKARIDWLSRIRFCDVKNFNNLKQKNIERCVTERFCYGGIHVQMVWYSIGLEHTPRVAFGDDPGWLNEIDRPDSLIIFLQTDTPNYLPREFDPYEHDLAQLARFTIEDGIVKWKYWMEKGFEKPWHPRYVEEPINIQHIPVSFLG